MDTQTSIVETPEPLPLSQWAFALRFVVPGKPQPRGSKVSFVPIHPKTKMHYRRPNGTIITATKDDNPESEPWMRLAARRAKRIMDGRTLFDGAVALNVRWYFERPKCHYRTGKFADQLRADSPVDHIQKPDCDKLKRCLGDALSGVVYVDDYQIVGTPGERKFWGAPARTVVQVYVPPEDHAAWLERNKF